MDKYLNGYSQILNHENQLETTHDLREFAEDSFSNVRTEAYGNKVESS